jgi:DNA polymerase/3'-5' exonuclease PolX
MKNFKNNLSKAIEELALEQVMYHVEVDRVFDFYAPAIIDFHKNLVKKDHITENYKYNHFVYTFDTMLSETVNHTRFSNADNKKMNYVKDSYAYMFSIIRNGYIYKPNHLVIEGSKCKIDWNKFNMESHIKFMKESISFYTIQMIDWKVMNGFWDGSNHVLKENKKIITEGSALGCNKKSHEYASKVFEKTSKQIKDVLEDNGFIIEGVYSAGSLRRQKSVVGDLDLLVNVIGHKDVGKINSHPLDEKIFSEQFNWQFGNSIRKNIDSKVCKSYKNITQFINEDMQCDIFFCTPTSIPTRRCYWTGSAAHNVKMMYEGFKKNILFSFDYLYDKNKQKFIVPKNEKEVFKVIGLDYIPPQRRV